jgi:PhoD related phosphatase
MPFGSQPTVQIYGKDYPVPAFIQTIQTPSECDPALKEHYFGPYLRFKNIDLQQNLWFGTVLLISPIALPLPQLEFHPSGDFAQLRPAPVHQIYTFAEYQFLRYELVLPVGPGEQKWTYAVTTQQTQTWEFTVAGKDQAWRFIAWSCGDFSAAVKKEERDKLGFETMWKNVMERYGQEGGFHAQLGGGGQIYADRMWKEIPY